MVYGDDRTMEQGKYLNVWKFVDGDCKNPFQYLERQRIAINRKLQWAVFLQRLSEKVYSRNFTCRVQ